MAREFAAAFYTSKKWRKCRRSYIGKRQAVDGGMCERCQREIGYIVHHKIWLTPDNITDPDVALNHEHLQYVCITCHNKIEEGERERDYCFDEEGQLIPLQPLEQ